LENIHKSFDGVEVLRGATLTVPRGEVVALIGSSGDGKSVLLKHMAGLIKPDAGRVLVDGQDLCCLRGGELARLRSRFGFLFQSGALFASMSVYDNVAFPLKEKQKLSEREIRDRVLVELEQVGLLGAEDKYPAQISGGMVKRAALARMMIRTPDIMFFDEPTTGLDPIIVHSIHNLIRTCHERLKFTAVIVSHEVPAVFSIVDKVAMLHRGVIQILATPKEVLTATDPVVSDFINGSVPPRHQHLYHSHTHRACEVLT
jgi:phospholipid/cholesterol/gamma-HCH transport system ATP-binding protein